MASFGFFAVWMVPLAIGVLCYDVLHVGHWYLLMSELVVLPPNLMGESLVFGVVSLNGL